MTDKPAPIRVHINNGFNGATPQEVKATSAEVTTRPISAVSPPPPPPPKKAK